MIDGYISRIGVSSAPTLAPSPAPESPLPPSTPTYSPPPRPRAGYNINGRGYPDISLLAQSYLIVANNSLFSISGTSASAPVFAGMVTLLNRQRRKQGKSTMGFLNPFLYTYAKNGYSYTTPSTPKVSAVISTQNNTVGETKAETKTIRFIRDITSGDNRCTRSSTLCCRQGFYAVPGWDPVSGLGSVDFAMMQEVAMAIVMDDDKDYDGSSGSVGPSFAPSKSPTPIPTSLLPTMIPSRSPSEAHIFYSHLPTFSPTRVPSLARQVTLSPTKLMSRSPLPSATPTAIVSASTTIMVMTAVDYSLRLQISTSTGEISADIKQNLRDVLAALTCDKMDGICSCSVSSDGSDCLRLSPSLSSGTRSAISLLSGSVDYRAQANVTVTLPVSASSTVENVYHGAVSLWKTTSSSALVQDLTQRLGTRSSSSSTASSSIAVTSANAGVKSSYSIVEQGNPTVAPSPPPNQREESKSLSYYFSDKGSKTELAVVIVVLIMCAILLAVGLRMFWLKVILKSTVNNDTIAATASVIEVPPLASATILSYPDHPQCLYPVNEDVLVQGQKVPPRDYHGVVVATHECTGCDQCMWLPFYGSNTNNGECNCDVEETTEIENNPTASTELVPATPTAVAVTLV